MVRRNSFLTPKEESGNYKMLAMEARRDHTAITVPEAASRAVVRQTVGNFG